MRRTCLSIRSIRDACLIVTLLLFGLTVVIGR